MKKNIVFGVVGFIVGGIGAYLYCKKRFDEGCCEEVEGVEEDIEDAKNPSDRAIFTPTVVLDLAKNINNEESDLGKQQVGYNKVVDKLYRKTPKEPQVITEIQFADEYDDFEKITLLYYDNGVITDENDDVMDDVVGVLGEDTLSCFGYGTSDGRCEARHDADADIELIFTILII